MIHSFKLTEGLLSRYANLVCDTVCPFQEAILNGKAEGVEPSHAIDNFRNAALKLKGGKLPEDAHFYGMVFQDSDVAKWIEAAAFSLVIKPDAELEARIDELCDLIADAQEEDGYLNTYFTLNFPERRFTNLHEAHELYCAGHMTEAAVSLLEATGNRKLLNVMRKNADLLYQHFILDGAEGFPGHPEIELALMRLWRVTGEDKYRDLAEHFINVRGVDPEFYVKEEKARGWKVSSASNPTHLEYSQCHKPVREQWDAAGHSVRAVYLYTAMADLASVTKDPKLIEACLRLFESISTRRMYITGGIGSTSYGEAFTVDYDLPSDTAYTETCASIGLIFFASKMLKLQRNGRFADVMERALYNTVLAGIELDGTKFFYSNPLEVIPGVSGVVHSHRYDLPQRPGWFSCACCPPNTARLLASIAKYIWDKDGDVLYSNLFAAGELKLPEVELRVETAYPFGNSVKYTVLSGATKLAVHIPSFSADHYTVSMPGEYRDGYYYLDVKAGDVVLLNLDLSPRLNRANNRVSENSGKAAVTVGPVVYCAEGVDNDGEVFSFFGDSSSDLLLKTESISEIGGFPKNVHDIKNVFTVEIQGRKLIQDNPNALYFSDGYHYERSTLKLIPYFMWGNRGLNQMRVWFPVS